MNPRILGGLTLVGRADVPEPGTWYRTTATHDGRPVFARVPLEGDGHEDEFAVATAWERLRHLGHPSVPRALAYDPAHQMLTVVAPDGIPLSQLIDHRHDKAFQMTPGTVLDVGTTLADVLVHAHERGRPHGHLSPDAVWVTQEGRLVVWGFSVGPDATGSSRWWAPERARGRRASGDADQWALAAILASLVTGRLPWRSDDPITEARVGDASHLAAPVMEQWKPLGRLLQRALAPEPRDRFPSVHPVRQALDALRDRAGRGSDLAGMGEALWERFAPELPEITEPEDAPLPQRLIPQGPAVGATAAHQAVHGSAPQPLSGDDVAPLTVEESEFDLATDHGTVPTQVPPDDGVDEGDLVPAARPIASRAPRPEEPVPSAEVRLEPEPSAPAPRVTSTEPPTAPTEADERLRMPAPAAAGPGSPTPVTAYTEPPSMGGDMAVAAREAPLAVFEPLDEVVDIRRIAPWTVAALVATVVLYTMGTLLF